jgi:hypothetical protein
VRREHKEETAMAAILRAWDAAPGGLYETPGTGTVITAITEALELQGLAEFGKLTANAHNLLRRVDARARAAAKLKKAGAS